jgi:hypothetical protein
MNHRFLLIVTLLGTIGLLAEDAFAQRPDPGDIRERMGGTSHADIQGQGDNGPKVGEVAPDFRLTPLKFYEFGIDEEEITEANAGELYAPVRLSSFKGKKPVVLIFGSYT